MLGGCIKELAGYNRSRHGECDNSSAVTSVNAMLSLVKPVQTKKGARMAIVEMEDLTGKIDGVVFPRTYEQVSEHIVPDKPLMLWGKVDNGRDEQLQLIIEDVEPVEAVQMVMVEIEPQIAGDIAQQHRLRSILLQHRQNEGQNKVPVVAVISGGARRQMVRLGVQFCVMDTQSTVNELVREGFVARSSALCVR